MLHTDTEGSGRHKSAGKSQQTPAGRNAGTDVGVPTQTPPSSLPEIVTVETLAAFLGVNRKTIYSAIDRGELPGARRVGRAIRIYRNAVLAWLASR